MTRVITEQELSNFVKGMVQGRDNLCIAVAFWGRDAILRLGLDKAGGGRILCNPELGYCDSKVIEELQEKKTFEIFAHPTLHAKLYMTKEMATVGSSNASSNGLAQELGDTTALRELNLATNDPVTLKQLHDWFEARWKEKIEIRPEMFMARPTGPFVALKSGSLIQALRQSPDYFTELPIYLMLYKQYVDKVTRAQIKSEVRNLKVGNLALKHSMRRASTPQGDSKTELASILGTCTEYVGWGKCFPRDCDAWLIDISKVRKATVWGIFRAYRQIRLRARLNADIAFKSSCITETGRSFELTEGDKQLLQDRFDDLWKIPDAKGDEDGRVLAFHAASGVLFR